MKRWALGGRPDLLPKNERHEMVDDNGPQDF